MPGGLGGPGADPSFLSQGRLGALFPNWVAVARWKYFSARHLDIFGLFPNTQHVISGIPPEGKVHVHNMKADTTCLPISGLEARGWV